MKFKIIYDNGKPSEIIVNSEAELKAELKNIFKDVKTDYYSYCELDIFDENDKDITISPFISLMIAEIQAEHQADLNITKICREKLK